VFSHPDPVGMVVLAYKPCSHVRRIASGQTGPRKVRAVGDADLGERSYYVGDSRKLGKMDGHSRPAEGKSQRAANDVNVNVNSCLLPGSVRTEQRPASIRQRTCNALRSTVL